MSEETEIREEIEPEVIPPAIEKRRKTVPIDMNELAALTDEGEDIVETRVRIWGTLRLACIRATSPEDWVLFRAMDKQSGAERITAYLQDSGCGRIRPLLGIEIRPPNGNKEFQFERTEVGGDFAYSVTGDGECKVTRQIVRGVVGTRYSTDDDSSRISDPIRKELRVKGNARVNLDGAITRQLAGLKTVPLAELQKAWEGTSKSTKQCPWGRGFKDMPRQKQNGPSETVEAPVCDLCGGRMEFVPAGKKKDGKSYPAFWSCPKGFGNNAQHAQSTMRHEDYMKMLSNQSREPGEEG